MNAAAELTAYVGTRPPGSTVTLQILRPNGWGTDQLKLTAVLGGAAVAQPAPRPAQPIPQQAKTATAASPKAAADVNQWISFIDPVEQAFTTEVPQG